MNMSDVVDSLIEVPAVTSFTRIGYAVRRRLSGWCPLDSFDLSDRVVVLTGATSGIGRAAAEQLASCGATLVLVGRSGERTERVAAEIVDATGNGAISAVPADMGDNTQVRALADRVLVEHERVDVLIHNAGALLSSRRESPSGLEATVASQVVGPTLLTGLLLERLARAAPSRVLTMSSGGMYTAPLTVSRLQMTVGDYNGAKQYARAKRAQVVLSEEWAARFGGAGIHVHALHPGWDSTPGISTSLPRFSRFMGPLLRSAEQGADTLVWLAADPAAVETNGAFWMDRHARRTHKLRSTRASDAPQRRERLWEWVVEAAGHEPSLLDGMGNPQISPFEP